MWACPKCDALLVHKNLSHSCVRRTVEEFLADKPQRGVELYHYFLAQINKIGPVIEHAVKTRIALMVEVRFSAINKIGRDHIDGHFWLKSEHSHQTFRKIENLNGDYIHHFRLSDETQIDPEFRHIMKMSYEIGERKHLPSH